MKYLQFKEFIMPKKKSTTCVEASSQAGTRVDLFAVASVTK